MTFREKLQDWTDWDGAQFALAVALGIMEDGPNSFQTKYKHVFWTANPLGDNLHKFLCALVELGILEQRSEPDDQFRWAGKGG